MTERVVSLTNIRTQSITKNVVDNVVQYRTGTITLKVTHSNSFSRETIKTKVFLQQIDNKIENVIETLNERMIRYVISLL